MFVCLCLGVTAREVVRAVEGGACTSKRVASMCGAGSDCGRCRPTLRSIIASAGAHAAAGEPPVSLGIAPIDIAPTSVCSRRAVCSSRIDTAMHAV
jgi:bacterioferritin-associated ferredoxin